MFLDSSLAAIPPTPAATLQDRYSFSPSDTAALGGVTDSVGKNPGTVVGNVTFTSAGAVFGGGSSSKSPSYIRLPTAAVSHLTNATIEIFATAFTPTAPYEALFDVSAPYTFGNGSATTYAILCANRVANPPGIACASCLDGRGEDYNVGNGGPNLGNGKHLVTEVYSGFSSLGKCGLLTIYLDGQQIAVGPTPYCYALLATGVPRVETVGIGGGSPYPDPTFEGNMQEVRIWNGALTPAQVLADYQAGSSQVVSQNP